MLAYHFLVWLLEVSARGHLFRTFQILGTFFAPAIFFFITGVTLSFSVMHRQFEGRSNKEVGWHVLKRYGGLILLGFLLNVVVWGYRSFWLWDVLEMIGLCNIIAFLALLSSSDLVLLLVGSTGLASYFLIRNITFPPLLEAILHNPLKGTFPLGPFLFFTVVGAVFGRRIIGIIRDEKEARGCRICFQVGGVLLAVSLLMHVLGLTITRYPVSLSYMAFATGVVLLVLGSLFYWQDVKEKKSVLLLPIMVYGRYALSIYVGHYLVYRLAHLLGLGRELLLWSSLIVSGVLFVAIFVLIIYVRPAVWKAMKEELAS